jgi:hypothetical protein
MESLVQPITWNLKASSMNRIGVSTELLRKKVFLYIYIYIDADLLAGVIAMHTIGAIGCCPS